tara:strand:- start:1334 stop:2140 length:807 start_codon:yes stop_codon:yes gene_type:complete
LTKIDKKITPNHAKKYPVFYVFLCLFMSFYVFFGKNGRVLSKNAKSEAFFPGEELFYKISYGKKNKARGVISAGHAKLSVKTDSVNNYIFEASGQTTKLFSLFMKVQHNYTSLVDPKTMNSIWHKMDITEGGYSNYDSIRFSAENFPELSEINDILSIAYRLRTTAEKTVREADTLFFSYYYNGQVFPSYIVQLGKEIIKTRFGKIHATKWSPRLEKGRIFRDTTGATVWITPGPIHIPLKIELPILVGSIYATLTSHKGTLPNLSDN